MAELHAVPGGVLAPALTWMLPDVVTVPLPLKVMP